MKKKIIVLSNSIDGGTGTYLEGLLALNKHYDILVLALEKPRFRKIKFKNINLFSPKNTLRFPHELKWFFKFVKSFHPDVVIAQDAHSITISELSKVLFKFKYKTISSIHNNIDKVIDYRLPFFLRTPFKLIFSLLIKRSTVVISVSKYLSRDLAQNFNLSKVPEVIPFLFPKKIEVVRGKTKNTKKRTIVSVSRLDLQKDHETLLKSFALIQDSFSNTELWLVGDGPLKSNLKKLTVKLSISSKVKFLGWHPNVKSVLDKADIFVLSTKWEGYPLTLIEAMARSLPVIATDCEYGSREILEDGKYGLLSIPQDEKSLGALITKLLSSNKDLKKYSDLSYQRSKYLLKQDMIGNYNKILQKLF